MDPVTEMSLVRTREAESKGWRNRMLRQVEPKSETLRTDLLAMYRADTELQRRRDSWNWDEKDGEDKAWALTKILAKRFVTETDSAIHDYCSDLIHNPQLLVPSDTLTYVPTLTSRSLVGSEDPGWRIAVGYTLTVGERIKPVVETTMDLPARKKKSRW